MDTTEFAKQYIEELRRCLDQLSVEQVAAALQHGAMAPSPHDSPAHSTSAFEGS